MSVNNSDDMVFLGKSLLGIVPFVGPFLSEVVSATIPNQRIDRLESFVKILEERLNDREKALKITNRCHVLNGEFFGLRYSMASRIVRNSPFKT